MIDAAHRHLDGRSYRLIDPDWKDGTESNCSIATWRICVDYYGQELTQQEQRDWMILDASRPWSPIYAAVSAGWGQSATAPTPGRYHLLQTWRSLDPLSSGHSKIFYEPPSPVVSGGLVIQATMDMNRAFLSVDFAEATKGLLWRMALLREADRPIV